MKRSRSRVKGTRSPGRPNKTRSPQARKRSTARRPQSRADHIEVREIESLRRELERVAKTRPPRWNADPEDVRRSVVKLVLTLVEFIRQLLERQALRRLDAGTLTADEIEAIGTALMRLEETLRDLAQQFDLSPEDLNLDLGPVGKLL
jgi:Gas vesicle protein K